MHSFSLPVSAHEHPPEFGNARSARDWLEQLDRSQPLKMQARLPEPGYWRQTHARHETVEKLGVGQRKIKGGALREERPISMRAGMPQPVDVVRSSDGSRDHGGQVLLMPAVERIGQPECVTLWSGWYRKSRNITLSGHHGERRVQRVQSLERGCGSELACIESVT